MFRGSFLISLVLAVFSFTSFSLAQQGNTTPRDTVWPVYEMPQIDIIGRKPGLLDRVPGSANIITEQQFKRVEPLSGNELFRRVPGVHPVDEEGAGLRLNIGIRGLEPDRSRTVLMLEDGVPISLAPYGEPEMYYTPSIDRMIGLEILKGSGSILFGPQTIGGVVNYITSDPPIVPTGSVRLRGGENGLFTSLLKYGTTSGNVGLQVNYLHRQADKLGTTSFRVNDLSAKFKFMLTEHSILGIKVSAYDELSNSTYIGLTQAMYNRGEYYVHLAQHDRLPLRRYSASATHDYMLAENWHMRTTIFGYTTSRNWQRQDYDQTRIVGRQYTTVWGDTTVAGGAVYMRNSTGNRNRQFEVAGVEPRVTGTFFLGEHKNEVDFGARFLYERAFEQFVIGTKFNSSSGDLRDDEIRTGYARSAFVQNRFFASDNLQVTPGIRFESFLYDRHIKRGLFRINGVSQVRDTAVIAENTITQVIPGIGVSYRFGDGSTIFTGFHRGFSPPRVKDAITGEGLALNLDAELSWNYEAGARYAALNGVSVEGTAFLLDFSNQIIPVSQSSGGTGTGLVNGGRTQHIGIEAGMSLDLQRLFAFPFGIALSTTATYVEATYTADRFVTSGNSSVNIKGNSLPYAPKFLFSGTLTAELPPGIYLQFSGTYVEQQFADELNTELPPAHGLTGVIPSYAVFDLSAKYSIASLNSTLVVAIKNIFDERYIVTRRPSGIRAGIPRTVSAGFDFSL